MTKLWIPNRNRDLRSGRQSLSKLEINLLPLKKYEGPVEIVASDEHLRAVMPELNCRKGPGLRH